MWTCLKPRLAARPAWRSAALATVLAAAPACRLHEGVNASGIEAVPHNRYLIGAPAVWTPKTLDRARLAASMAERRVAAWATVERVLRPVPLVDPQTQTPLTDARTGKPLSIPTWQTWYELDEFRAMFQELYWTGLTDAQRGQLATDAGAVDKVMAAFPRTPLEHRWRTPKSGDTVPRFQRLLSQIADAKDIRSVNGVSGAGFTLFSPALVRHYLLHYGSASKCTGTPPGLVTNTPADFATCLGEPFPVDAVAIKATWSEAGAGIGVFDTSAKGLAQLMATNNQSWLPVSDTALANPGDDQIYSATTFVDDRRATSFQLTGMHIITKEIPEWMWVTLWWSPTPTVDFGEDRPDAVTHVDGPEAKSVWANYKMCTVSAFDEGDPTLAAGAAGLSDAALLGSTDPSLRAALLSGYHFGQPNTLCSNPYIEFKSGMGGTNCIGCHQHAGPFASHAMQAPDRAQLRKSFMTDFMWSFEDTTEQFRGAIIQVLNNPPG